MRKPLITEETLSDATLDHWKEEFWFLYHKPDLKQNLHRVWSMAYEDATRVGEAIRENNMKDCLEHLAHTFCWIACFVAKLAEGSRISKHFKIPQFQRLSNVVWYKYPNICPTCFSERCICPLKKRLDKPSEEEQRIKLETFRDKPAPDFSMERWEKMFERIYENAHFIRSLDELGFHLLEEMGEVEEVIRKIATWGGKKWRDEPQEEEDLVKLQLRLVEEVADTVSWCFSIVRKIAKDARKYQELEKDYGRKRKRALTTFTLPRLTLSQVLWNEYHREGRNEIVCHKCGERPCNLEEIKWVLTDGDSSNERNTL